MALEAQVCPTPATTHRSRAPGRAPGNTGRMMWLWDLWVWVLGWWDSLLDAWFPEINWMPFEEY